MGVNVANSDDFCVHFRSTSTKIALLALHFFKKCSPDSLRYLKNKIFLKLNFSHLKIFRGKYAHPTPPPNRPHNKSFFFMCLRGSKILKPIKNPGEALSIKQGFAGPQRRGSVMGSKEYKVGLKILSIVGLLRPKTML